MVRVSGTEGYAQEAPRLVSAMERVSSEEDHALVRHLIPSTPGRVLDIGSGTGRDAEWLDAMGHRVTAAEPVDELRMPGMTMHPSPTIEWLDDGLPELPTLVRRGETFDLVKLTAVWMHLDEDQRRRGMPNLAALTRTGGHMLMSLRHGPVPPGRRMFPVTAEETVELAAAHGFANILRTGRESIQEINRRMGVTWTWLGFVKG